MSFSTELTKYAGVEGGGFSYSGDTPSYSTKAYLQLRRKSSALIRRRPRFDKLNSSAQDWSSFLENVLTEGEGAVQTLLKRDKNDCTSVEGIVSEMLSKLKKVGKSMAETFEEGSSTECDILLVSITEFWVAVNKFLKVLFEWTKLTLVKILGLKCSLEQKGIAVQDVFDRALDLLWGIYA